MRVLIVEDDPDVARQLRDAVLAGGMVGDVIGHGEEAMFVGATEDFDAAVLDLGLPGRDGLSVLRHWREQGCGFPVLILTARNRWSDKLEGFGAGADDFLVKPVLFAEVPLRLRAMLRRQHGHAASVIRVGDLEFDTVGGRFSLASRPLALTAQEQRILGYLMHRPGQLVSRMQIAEHVYSRELERDSNTIDVLIGRIRRKLGRALIQTERGLGFRLLAAPHLDDA
jgi:two-component system OmpR family response regulator